MSIRIKAALLRRASALAVVAVVVASPAFAADLRGRVVDSAGSPLPGAAVSVGGRTATAGADRHVERRQWRATIGPGYAGRQSVVGDPDRAAGTRRGWW